MRAKGRPKFVDKLTKVETKQAEVKKIPKRSHKKKPKKPYTGRGGANAPYTTQISITGCFNVER
jgi:hypothetical protein